MAGHSESDDLEQAMEPVLLAERVLNAFENRQWDVIGNLEREPGGSMEVELLQVIREMFSEPLHFTLAQRFPVANGYQERRYAIRSGTAQGRIVLQVCPFDDGWRWTHLSFTPAPALTARFMFESQMAEALGIPAVYFLCEDDRYLDKGDVLLCEAGFVNRETALFGLRVHDDNRLEVVTVEIAGEDGPPTNEQVISAACGFLQPLLAGDLDQALRHTGAGFADPVSRLALREIARDLAADRGPLQSISQIGEQLNPGRLPAAYLFKLDFERSSARIELYLVAGEHML